MPTLVFIITGSFLLVLQTSLFTTLPPWIGNPDLLFLLVVYLATRVDNLRGFFLVLLFGLLMDIFAGVAPGLYPLVYGGLFLTLKLLSRQLIFDEPSHQPALAALSYLACNIVIYLYVVTFTQDSDITWKWHTLLLALLIQAVLALPLFHLFDLINKTFSVRRDRIWLPSRSKTGNRFTS